jgi:hypothetical protein
MEFRQFEATTPRTLEVQKNVPEAIHHFPDSIFLVVFIIAANSALHVDFFPSSCTPLSGVPAMPKASSASRPWEFAADFHSSC